ncbi:outer membrane beta-barrel protein [Sulfurimonas sp.]|uniref:outer membrane beta-barrel protein n=1 Tax=Sulfurimonas sp. TaxID=2022749 RepID=UPI0019E432E0|nr:outer membrane beta-barrel protein [Sulfurimonas sp.]MBE0513623.1 outer membrane beta-barrel protein [Sulfurimonas sp.]
MLKKSALSSLLALSLASSLMAENYVYVGASKADIMEQSTTSFSIGYGFSKVFSNCVMVGFSGSYHQGDYEESSATGSSWFNGLGVDFHLGYSPTKPLALYGIAGYQVQAISSSTSADGFGYGAGVSYKFFEHVALALEYRTYDMEVPSLDYKYDYDTLDALIRFVW